MLKFVTNSLEQRQATLGEDTIVHETHVLDPKEVFGTGGALAAISSGELTAPTFMVQDLPPATQALVDLVKSADCYLIVSPEHNHVAPPALASLMGHFGGSCYAAKPSAILTYSPSPWGGMRAAVSIASMCHELGCLPVSKFCGFPMVGEMLGSDGTPTDPAHRMLKQFPSMSTQLEWMAVAMKTQRDKTGAF